MIVYLESMDDIGSDGLDDAKYTISSTRAAEAQFSADDARTQAETVINAADDTEQSQAEQALLDMGPKALPVLKDEMGKAGDVEKERLRKVIDAVSPPSILWAMKQN
jgi:CBS-domain-containing membrane protein